MKKAAVIASCDTKCAEVQFLCGRLRDAGVDSLVIDISVGLGQSAQCAAVSREQVFTAAGLRWDAIRDKPKGELVRLMQDAVKITVLDLYKRHEVDGIIAIGGVQNTSIAAGAMQMLPIGFPKVAATTIASGSRPFQSVAGDKDIVIIPSIADFSGLNTITKTIIANAAGALAGLVTFAGSSIQKSDKTVVGITLMGVTNSAAAYVTDELARAGVETIGFHATGAGGRIMEQLAEEKILDGILDLCTHEITSEYFGGGFSYGALNRLVKPLESGIPMVICTGGLDFVDYAVAACPLDLSKRKYNKHNSELAHIKITVDEAREIGEVFAKRLAHAKNKTPVLIPADGMRLNTGPGESLYDPDVDAALAAAIQEHAPASVVIKSSRGNINDENWARNAAREMLTVLRDAGLNTEAEGERHEFS